MTTHLNSPSDWRGIWTALVTPLNSDLSLDSKSLENLVENQIQSQVTGLVLAGSTGEGSLLGQENYALLLKKTKSIVGSKIPLVAGVGIGGTHTAVERAKLALECGMAGVLASPPAYIRPTQKGLEEHFLQIANVGLPVCLYEIPSRAAQTIQIQTIESLLKNSHPAAKKIVALKDASADLQRAGIIAAKAGPSLAMLSGDDGTFVPFLATGGSGIISVVSHFVAPVLKKALEFFEGGKLQQAQKFQNDLFGVIDACFAESNPIPAKAFLKGLGIIKDDILNPPLTKMEPRNFEKHFPVIKNFSVRSF